MESLVASPEGTQAHSHPHVDLRLASEYFHSHTAAWERSIVEKEDSSNC